jgi:Uma2 family endonuclease
MGSATHILTLEEALALPVDPLDEIVDGEVRRMSQPEDAHAALLEVLYDALRKQLPGERFKVRLTAYGLGVRREPRLTIRNPDLTVFDFMEWSNDFVSRNGRGWVWIAPKLVVECLSPSNRKGSTYQLLADYESCGAAEVWLIDPKRRLLTPYVRADEQLIQKDSLSEGMLTPAAVPASIDVSLLWHAFETGS